MLSVKSNSSIKEPMLQFNSLRMRCMKGPTLLKKRTKSVFKSASGHDSILRMVIRLSSLLLQKHFLIFPHITPETLFNLILFPDQSASLHRRTTCWRPATTTSWCWRTYRAIWRCRSPRWWSPSTRTRWYRAAGILWISHSCRRPPTRPRHCGRCHRSKKE